MLSASRVRSCVEVVHGGMSKTSSHSWYSICDIKGQHPSSPPTQLPSRPLTYTAPRPPCCRCTSSVAACWPGQPTCPRPRPTAHTCAAQMAACAPGRTPTTGSAGPLLRRACWQCPHNHHRQTSAPLSHHRHRQVGGPYGHVEWLCGHVAWLYVCLGTRGMAGAAASTTGQLGWLLQHACTLQPDTPCSQPVWVSGVLRPSSACLPASVPS